MSVTSTTARPKSRDAWRSDAACRDLDTNLFFPVGEGESAKQTIAEAKTICAGCPVRAECLAFAVSTRQDAGVWGGLTEEERGTYRRRLARERRKQQQAS